MELLILETVWQAVWHIMGDLNDLNEGQQPAGRPGQSCLELAVLSF